MNRNFIAQSLGDPSKNLLFFLAFGTFGLAIASDVMSDLVLNKLGAWLAVRWGINAIAFRCTALGSIVLMLFSIVWLSDLSERLGKRYAPAKVKPQPLKATLPGLIVVASKTRPGVISAAEAAIAHHWNAGNGNLQHLWIICGGQDILANTRNLLTKLTGDFQFLQENRLRFTFCDCDRPSRQLEIYLEILDPTEVDDPNATFNLTNKIYQQAAAAGLEPGDIIADYTGGTKSMTAGTILTCASPEKRLQFMRPGGYTADGRAYASLPSAATEVRVEFQLKAPSILK